MSNVPLFRYLCAAAFSGCSSLCCSRSSGRRSRSPLLRLRLRPPPRLPRPRRRRRRSPGTRRSRSTASCRPGTSTTPTGRLRHLNQYRVFDYQDNSVNIDAAEIVLQKAVEKPGDAGFRVDAVAGAVARVASAAGLFQGQDFDLQQAFVSYVAPLGSGLRFDFGKFVTHMGYEVIEGYDGWNDNATRSFVFGYAIPFTNTGLKASYTFGDELAGMLLLTNGWDVVKDNNSGKSFGAQLVWTPSKAVTVTGNYIGGPEQREHERDTGETSATSWASGRPPTDGLHPRADVRKRAECRDGGPDGDLERHRRLRAVRPQRQLRPQSPGRVLRRPGGRPDRRRAVPQGGHADARVEDLAPISSSAQTCGSTGRTATSSRSSPASPTSQPTILLDAIYVF